jgi:hypothetical protein
MLRPYVSAFVWIVTHQTRTIIPSLHPRINKNRLRQGIETLSQPIFIFI